MDCKQGQNLLYGYVCSALTEKQNKVLQKHLEICEGCQKQLQDVEQRLQKFRDQEQTPDISAQKILAGVRRKALLLRYISFAVLVAVFLGILAVGLLIARYRHEYALLSELEKAIVLYHQHQKTYPAAENLVRELQKVPETAPYLEYWQERLRTNKHFVDYWGNKIIYRYPGKNNPGFFDLYSYGRNGKDEKGHWDDLRNWHGKRRR